MPKNLRFGKIYIKDRSVTVKSITFAILSIWEISKWIKESWTLPPRGRTKNSPKPINLNRGILYWPKWQTICFCSYVFCWITKVQIACCSLSLFFPKKYFDQVRSKVRSSQGHRNLIFTNRIQQDLFYQWNNSKMHLTGKI